MLIAYRAHYLLQPYQAVQNESTVIFTLADFDAFSDRNKRLVILAKSEANACFVERWLVDLGCPSHELEDSSVTVQSCYFLPHIVVKVHVHVLDSLTTIFLEYIHIGTH
jgi:hypothetical protein